MQPQRYITFLRAINVGGHTVKMDHLRQLFTALGYTHIETFIASGNVIFTAPGDPPTLEHQIAHHLHTALGYPVATFLRTPADLAAIAQYQPFPATDPALTPESPQSAIRGALWAPQSPTLYIGFLPHAPADPKSKIQNLKSAAPTDDFHLHHRELYWHVPTHLSDSPLTTARLEKLLTLPLTLRNSTTVRRLTAKYPPHKE
jgi:uncharacterized protein (DUF1697 family)